MAGDISLAAFKSALGRGASWRDASRCVVLTRKADEIQAIVAKPVSPVSTWSRLFGTTRLYKAMFGPASYREPRRQDQLTTLHAFKAALEDEYRPVIAQAAFKTLRSRDVLLLSEARSALRLADEARREVVAKNEGLLKSTVTTAMSKLNELTCFSGSSTWTEATFTQALRAYLGGALDAVRVPTETMEEAARLLADLVLSGLPEGEVSALLVPENGFIGDSARHRLTDAHQLRVRHVQACEVAERIRETSQRDSKYQPDAAAVQRDGPTALDLSLARAALDPADGLPMKEEQIQAALERVDALHRRLADTPLMSEPRNRLILDFAASLPLDRRQDVVERLCSGSLKALTDHRGVLTGFRVGDHLPPEYRAPRVDETLTELLRENVKGAKTETLETGTGTYVTLSSVCLRDSRRDTPHVIKGQVVQSAKDGRDVPFARQFRGHFPGGESGDTLARWASAFLNQNNLNAVLGKVAGISTGRKDQDVLHEAERLDDGSWRLRTTCRMLIHATMDTDGWPVRLAKPVAALYVIEGQMTPSKSPGEDPQLEATRIEVAFA